MWFIFAIGITLTILSQYFAGEAPYLEIKVVLPTLMIVFGLAFGCMAVILGGSFYGLSLACLLMGVCQTMVSRMGETGPAICVGLFGVVFFLGLFIPGWKNSKATTSKAVTG
jgi:predicted Co/Zn/Cd cation transporter (cation efflux family)